LSIDNRMRMRNARAPERAVERGVHRSRLRALRSVQIPVERVERKCVIPHPKAA